MAAATDVEPAPTSLPRRAGVLVFAAVFLCASCGMVYELALITVGSYLLGNAVVQASIVLSVMVFAMGVGALLSKRLVRRAAAGFAVIELVLGLLGGLSVVLLYTSFAWLRAYTAALVVLALLIGGLIGAEIPLLMTLLQRIRSRRASDEVADLFAADYVGGLVGGLLFPFLLLPTLGLLKGALATGAVNAVVGSVVVLWLFRESIGRGVRRAITVAMALVLLVLAAAWLFSDEIEVTSRQQLYSAPIIHAERTAYQEIVLTRLEPHEDTRLFLNGNLQLSSTDEYRYHEALVHPVMAPVAAVTPKRVLVLGGGDGMAVRELLKYPVEQITLVDLDPAMTRLAQTHPRLLELNRGALSDPRVRVLHDDAFSYLRNGNERFDAIVQDLPDPSTEATAKLYSLEMFAMAQRALAPGGRMVVQSTSPYFARDAYWCIGRTLTEAGLAVRGYHVDVPTFGDWGFFLAARPGEAGAATGPPETPDLAGGPQVGLAPAVGELRFLTPEVLAGATAFPRDAGWRPVKVSTLLEPAVIDYHRKGWRTY
ncbi:spermidine synthase [Enemella dayhoffiae]|uniref:Polyamine aminopropyltransferase n=1 Tax=Enemella dayhoffiae TaxID=2016507 RepID=A0A255HBH5_9ACTN|nr:polyamine aminopropyltransferase [Enemella dayhoffiae]OYO25358.1 spermidine synthase [Enemella dayhoffiae]